MASKLRPIEDWVLLMNDDEDLPPIEEQMTNPTIGDTGTAMRAQHDSFGLVEGDEEMKEEELPYASDDSHIMDQRIR